MSSPAPSSSSESYLNSLLSSPSAPLSAHTISLLSASLLPSAPPRLRSLSYLLLSKSLNIPSASTTSAISASIQAGVSDTDPQEILRSLGLLGAVLAVEPSVGAEVLGADGLLDSIMDMVELPFFDSPLITSRVRLSVGELLSSASGVPKLRSLVIARSQGWLESNLSSSISSSEYKGEVEGNQNTLRIISAVTLTKLDRAASADPSLKASSTPTTSTDEGLAKLLSAVIISSSTKSSSTIVLTEASGPTNHNTLNDLKVISALEGLAYTSLTPSLKPLLSSPSFLSALFSLAHSPNSLSQTVSRKSGLSASYSKDIITDSGPESRDTAKAFGITTILSNLFCQPPRLTEEQSQIAQLKALASTPSASGSTNSPVSPSVAPQDQPEAIQRRVELALELGVVAALKELAAVESVGVKEGVGRVMLGLVEEQGVRARVVREGGGVLLRRLVGALTADKGGKEKDTAKEKALDGGIGEGGLPALQALAKLVITTNPSHLFHPDPPTTSLDCIRPLSLLLLHLSANTLQRFEALMALTNISSLGEGPSGRIVRQAGLFGAVEESMIGENYMVRRAAVELVCNLVGGCQEGFELYSPEGRGAGEKAKARSRLHVLLAMTDVDDLPTRLAASGALAGVTQGGEAVEGLLGLGENGREGKKVFEMVDLMFAPPVAGKPGGNGGEDEDDEDADAEDIQEISTLSADAGLIHRASILLHNLLSYISEQSPVRRSACFGEVVKSGVLGRLLDLLGEWTRADEGRVKPSREMVEGVVGCLKILKEAGVDISRA